MKEPARSVAFIERETLSRAVPAGDVGLLMCLRLGFDGLYDRHEGEVHRKTKADALHESSDRRDKEPACEERRDQGVRSRFHFDLLSLVSLVDGSPTSGAGVPMI